MNQIIKFKIDEDSKKAFQKKCVEMDIVPSELLREFVHDFINGNVDTSVNTDDGKVDITDNNEMDTSVKSDMNTTYEVGEFQSRKGKTTYCIYIDGKDHKPYSVNKNKVVERFKFEYPNVDLMDRESKEIY